MESRYKKKNAGKKKNSSRRKEENTPNTFSPLWARHRLTHHCKV
jgi:hypothetical protein